MRKHLQAAAAIVVLGVAFVPTASAQTSAPRADFDSAWSAISRTYWDTSFVSGHWRSVRDSLRGTLGENADADAVRRAIRALIAVPEMSHFVLLPKSALDTPSSSDPMGTSGSREGARPGSTGLDVRPVGTDVVVWRVEAGSPAAKAGIRTGDIVTRLDTMPVPRLRQTLRESMPKDSVAADRLVTTLIKGRLGGGVGDTLRLTVRDARGRETAHRLVRTPMTGTVTKFGNLPSMVIQSSATRETVKTPRGSRTVAIISWSGWFPVLSPKLDTMFFASRDADALIIDLRGNPGGVIGMLAGVAGHMLDTSVSLGELKTRSGVMRFAANPRSVDRSGGVHPPFKGPVAILVDEYSASTSEFFAAGMQALGRARVFGTRSAGMALPAAAGALPSGDILMHVIADHADAKGRRVEGIGVIPEEPTPLTLVDLRSGRDAALEAARAWIARGAP